jgi:hypothetical protein
MNPIPVPPGHPWSCSTCQVTVSVVHAAGLTEVQLGHDDGCPTFAARLRSLVPGLENDPDAFTVRQGTATDEAEAAAMFPRW